METSREWLAQQKMSHMEIVQETASGNCVEGCQGQWYECGFEVLTNNGIGQLAYSAALCNLQNSRGKYLNIMIVGPANWQNLHALTTSNTLQHLQ